MRFRVNEQMKRDPTVGLSFGAVHPDQKRKYADELLGDVVKDAVTEAVAEGERYGKPFLTIGEAATILRVSEKRLRNMISEIKRDVGRRPAWVVNAKGKTRQLVDRERFIEWVRKEKKRAGRPPKQ